MTRTYGGLIWTDHALQRLKQRKIRQADAWLAFRSCDRSRFARNRGAWVYDKTFQNKTIEVVAKQNERKEWIVLSVWSKPARMRFSKPDTFPAGLLIIGIVLLVFVLLIALFRLS